MTICRSDNVIPDPQMNIFRQYIRDTNGIPSVVWQQQMEKAYIKTYKEVHNDRPDRYYEFDYTKDIETQFRPSQLIEVFNPQYIGPEYGKDPFRTMNYTTNKTNSLDVTIILQRTTRMIPK